MADLEDLNIPSITDMSVDEAIENLRQIRLSRRMPKKRKKTTKKTTKPKQSKLSAKQAANILKILEGQK